MEKTIELAEYIRPSAIGGMRSAIKAADGNEVFFRGKTDRELMVREVSVLARGNGESVPAIVNRLSLSDVVIHNHPDGCLYPSKPDLAIASELGNRGVGFYIVDNAVEKIYPVVYPAMKEEMKELDAGCLKACILPGGEVSGRLEDYEYREEQRVMMEKVVKAFNEERIALIEAGTGTGKSLAYLIPAISWSLANKERVVISTNTINLQEQLVGKDLPLLQGVSGLRCKAVLVKGRSNYLCLRKLASLKEEILLLARKESRELGEIAAWAEKTGDGSLSDLSFVPGDDIWEQVCAESDTCTRIHCPFFGECFFYKARRKASSADILIVNHHLLMADLAVRSRMESYDRPAVLPRFHRIIFDEAQHLEDVATSYFGFQISKYGFIKQLRRLQSSKKAAKGVLPFLYAKLRSLEGSGEIRQVSEALALIEETIAPQRRDLEKRIKASVERIASGVKGCAENDGDTRITMRITPDTRASAFWNEVMCSTLIEMMRALDPLLLSLKKLGALLSELSDRQKKEIESPHVEILAIRRRLGHYLECLAFFMDDESEHCRWLELKKGRRGELLRFCAAPLEVSRGMRETIYQRFGTVVMTSATLTVGGSFDYIRNRLGLWDLPEGRLDCSQLPSPFDYGSQAIVAAPRGIAAPGSSGYEEMLEKLLRRAVEISRGRAFVLFTSYKLLRSLHAKLERSLGEMGIPALMQGTDNRTALIKRFRRERGAVLFATDSFWEGVDVRGDALQCVVITRLPFRVPSEPIQQARFEAVEQAGGDPFMEYSVPQAVIKFRQGFGRLIRHRDDTGAVVILDVRVHSKRYGRIFLDSLPHVPVRGGATEDVLREMERFFARIRGSRTKQRAATGIKIGLHG
jgi:ATP-dependent DNA helicase DinG